MESSNTKPKESFIFYRSFANSIDRLPAEMQLPLYRAITAYALDLNEPTFDDCQDKYILLALWDNIKPQLDANHKRYLNGCKGKEYGKLGGAPKGNQNAKKKQPQNNPKTTPNDNVNVNVNDNVNVGVIGDESPQHKTTSTKKFIPPTIEEVQEYCKSRNNFVDAEKFISHYQSNGWRVGKNPMKDWKAAVRTWERTYTNTSTNAPQQMPGKKLSNMEDLI